MIFAMDMTCKGRVVVKAKAYWRDGGLHITNADRRGEKVLVAAKRSSGRLAWSESCEHVQVWKALESEFNNPNFQMLFEALKYIFYKILAKKLKIRGTHFHFQVLKRVTKELK